MPQYGFFLSRIFPYKDRLFHSCLRENQYSGIFDAVIVSKNVLTRKFILRDRLLSFANNVK